MSHLVAKVKRAGINIARSTRLKRNNDGVSCFTKERVYVALATKADKNQQVFITQKEIGGLARTSTTQTQRAIDKLRKSGEIFVQHVYQYSEYHGKRIRTGSIITLRKIRAKLKAAFPSVFDLNAKKTSQLLYTDSNQPESPTGIAMFRHYSWINRDTGEEMLTSTPELVRVLA